MIHRCACLILAAILSAACQAAQPERTCDEVRGRSLREIMQEPGSSTEARVKIANAYGLAPEQVLMSSNRGGTGFQWSRDDVTFNMGMGAGVPIESGLDYQSRQPSIATVIKCLEAPDFYLANYERGGPEASWNVLELYLYFPRQGALAAAYTHHSGKEPPKLNMEMTMRSFRIVPVSSAEETMAWLNANYSPEFRQQIKPWPGRLEDLVVDVDPDLTW